MSEEIILGLKLDTSGAKQPIAELEESLNRMRNEIKTLPSDSAAFKKVASEIRKVDAELKNVNKGLEGMSREKLSEGLGKIVGGASAAVAGFSLLSQAFGATKESAEQMQAAFNTAFGAMNAVKGITELFGGLDAILPTATAKFKALDTAMKFSVIGIIALAVGGLVMALSSLSKEEEKVETATDKANKKIKEQEEHIKDLRAEFMLLNNAYSEYLSAQEKILEINIKQEKSFKDISDLANLYGQEVDLAVLSNEEFLEVLKRVEGAEKKYNDTQTEKLEILNSSKNASFRYINSLESQRIAQEKLIGSIEEYIEVETESANGLTQYISVKNPEYRRAQSDLLTINNKLTEAKQKDIIVNQKFLTQLEELEKKTTSESSQLIADLQSEAQKRGIVSEAAAKQKESEERLRQEQIKARDLQREINDQLTEYAFLRREIDIRITNEGIDIAEERGLALLQREQEYQTALTELKRNEVLNTKQKNDAELLLQEQYRIDLIDINAEFDTKQQEQDERARDEKKKLDEEQAAYELQLTKRTNLAIAEAEYLHNKESLDAQINWMHAQRDAELMNTELTAEERYLIKLKWAQKENELVSASEKKELDIRKQNTVAIIELYDEFSSIISGIMDANLAAFQRDQAEELSTFTKTKDDEYAALEVLAEDDIVLRENLEAERKRIDGEKEIFEMEQAERLKQRQKKQAGIELGLMLGQSIANIAAAIIKAQVNPGFPLSIEETIRIAALGLAQVASITAQISKINSFRDGGVISGPSHEGGGVKFAVGGQVNELEGGEGVINKRSMAMPQVAAAASYLNQLGGGVAFDTSLAKNSQNSQIATLSAMVSRGESSLVRAYVVESDISDKQKLNEKIRNKAKF